MYHCYRLLVLAAVMLVSSLSSKCYADTSMFKIAEAVGDAFEMFSDVTGKTNELTALLLKAQDGTIPDIPDSNFSSVTEGYEAATKKLESEPLPTIFDTSGYSVAPEDFTQCRARPDLLSKLNGYLTELREAQDRGKEYDQTLSARYSEAEEVQHQAIPALRKLYEELIGLGLGQFAHLDLDLLDLATKVPASLGRFQSAIADRKKRLSDDLKKLDTMVSNLSGNLSDIENGACDPSGAYKSMYTYENGGLFDPETFLVLTKADNGYACSLSSGGEDLVCCNAAYSSQDRQLTFSFECDHKKADSRAELHLDESYRSLVGSIIMKTSGGKLLGTFPERFELQ